MTKVRVKKISHVGEQSPKAKSLTGKEKRLQNLRPPWKKGEGSPNPGGVPKDGDKPRLNFWPHILRFGNMTKPQLEVIKRDEALTMFQLGAIAFVEKFIGGSMPHHLEILNREIGPPESKPIKSPDEQAALAREYLRQMQSSVPSQEGVPK